MQPFPWFVGIININKLIFTVDIILNILMVELRLIFQINIFLCKRHRIFPLLVLPRNISILPGIVLFWIMQIF